MALTPDELVLAEMALKWLWTKLQDEFEKDKVKAAAEKVARLAGNSSPA